MPNLPSFTFYPGDWLRNDVAGCSLEAQGLWLRMMMVMHDAEVYGELSVNGQPMPDEFIAKKCGISRTKYRKFLKELEDFSVINREKTGVIYSGRMRRDDEKRQQNAGRQRKFYEAHKAEPNAKPNTPSSSSSSISISKEEKKKKAATPKQTDEEWLKEISESEAYRNLPVSKEFDKATIWAKTNGKQCTRRFFIRWLNRIQPMIVTNGNRPPDPGKYDPSKATPVEPDLPCEFCGKEICFSLHDEERRQAA
jgi:DNA-binding Lrp family transcriptional regulator